MRYLILLFICVVFVGCKKPAEPVEAVPTIVDGLKIGNEQRITIKRIGSFNDDIAYGNVRGVYLITDKETEKEYIGISGIGISETGSHTVKRGKHDVTVADER